MVYPSLAQSNIVRFLYYRAEEFQKVRYSLLRGSSSLLTYLLCSHTLHFLSLSRLAFQYRSITTPIYTTEGVSRHRIHDSSGESLAARTVQYIQSEAKHKHRKKHSKYRLRGWWRFCTFTFLEVQCWRMRRGICLPQCEGG